MSPWFDSQCRLRLGWRILLGIAVAILANIIALDFAASFARQSRAVDAIYRPVSMVLLLAGFLGLLRSADRIPDGAFLALGLGRSPHWRAQILAGIVIAAALVCFAVLGIIAVGQMSVSVALNGRTLALALLEVMVLATGAMAEELIFRGYPFQRLVDAFGSAGAVCLFAFLFGLVHLQNPHSSTWALINTVAIGVLLAIAYLRTRSLWMAWGMHFGWNTVLGLVFGLPVSGLTDFAVVVKSRAQGPRWLTGGAYGIEGGALGTIVILLGFVPVFWATAKGRLSAGAPQSATLQTAQSDAGAAADEASHSGIQL